MALTDVINRPGFKTGDYTVTRQTASTYVNGIATPGSTSTFSMAASIQPATGSELMALKEGQRTEETRMVLTTNTNRLNSRKASQEPDVVSVDGDNWVVVKADTWTAFGQTWTRAWIARREVQG